MFIIVVTLAAIASVLPNLKWAVESFNGLLAIAGILTFWGVVLFNEQAIQKFFIKCVRFVWNFFRTI
jgi:hypothetical protein